MPLFLVSLASAQSLNVNFSNLSGVSPSDTYAADGCAGTWNEIDDLNATHALTDVDGNSGASLVVTTTLPAWVGTGGSTDADALHGTNWIEQSSGAYTLSFSGIEPASYAVIAYSGSGYASADLTVETSSDTDQIAALAVSDSGQVTVTVGSDGALTLSGQGFFTGLAGIQLQQNGNCLPTYEGVTLVENSDGTFTASLDDYPGYSIEFPAGTTFDADANIEMNADYHEMVTRLEITGVDLAGGTKSVLAPFDFQHADWDYSIEVWNSRPVCAYDDSVDPGTLTLSVCGGNPLQWVWSEGDNFLTMGHSRYAEWDGSGPATLEGDDGSVTATQFEDQEIDGVVYKVPIDAVSRTDDLSHTFIYLYADDDNDGLADYDEVEVYGTDPTLMDSDEDGMPDGVEVLFDSDPTDGSSVADLDADQDGLNALMERVLGTDSDVADTDGDGVNDGDEVTDGTDPLDAGDSTFADSDSDGVDDRYDNCPDDPNPDQEDADGDGIGTACDDDEGGDTGPTDTGPDDTDDTQGDDTDDTDEPEPEPESSCGCASPAAPVSLLFLVPLLVIRRRR